MGKIVISFNLGTKTKKIKSNPEEVKK